MELGDRERTFTYLRRRRNIAQILLLRIITISCATDAFAKTRPNPINVIITSSKKTKIDIKSVEKNVLVSIVSYI